MGRAVDWGRQLRWMLLVLFLSGYAQDELVGITGRWGHTLFLCSDFLLSLSWFASGCCIFSNHLSQEDRVEMRSFHLNTSSQNYFTLFSIAPNRGVVHAHEHYVYIYI